MAASSPALKKNAIGMWQIVFFVIAAAAPLTGMLGIIPVATPLRGICLRWDARVYCGGFCPIHPRFQSPYKASYAQTGCAAVIVFFWRNGLDKRVWNTVVAPVLGMAGLGYADYGGRG